MRYGKIRKYAEDCGLLCRLVVKGELYQSDRSLNHYRTGICRFQAGKLSAIYRGVLLRTTKTGIDSDQPIIKEMQLLLLALSEGISPFSVKFVQIFSLDNVDIFFNFLLRSDTANDLYKRSLQNPLAKP